MVDSPEALVAAIAVNYAERRTKPMQQKAAAMTWRVMQEKDCDRPRCLPRSAEPRASRSGPPVPSLRELVPGFRSRSNSPSADLPAHYRYLSASSVSATAPRALVNRAISVRSTTSDPWSAG